MYFTENCQPRFDDYDMNGCLSPEAILKILENASMHHTEVLQGRVSDDGTTWVLLEWRVEIARRPRLGERLRVRTWVHGKAPASSVARQYVMTDENGEVLARAEARFVLFDLKANRLMRIDEVRFATYQPEEETAFDAPAPHLRELIAYESETPVTLRRSDIDANGHVHNTRYFDFALEALPEDVYARGVFSALRVLYRVPVKKEDAPVLRAHVGEDGAQFALYAGPQVRTLMEVRF